MPKNWYASASSTGGNGSVSNPWNVASLVASPFVLPGDTVTFAAGTYGTITTTHKGTAAKPITYQASGHVIIDGQIVATSAEYIKFIGFHITDTTSFAGGRPVDLSVGTAGYLVGNGCKLINCIIENHLQGASGGGTADSWELYGNLFLFNGSDSQLGHGIYVQHKSANGLAIVKRNLFTDNFGWNIHLYGTELLAYFQVVENTCFAAGSIRSEPRTNLQLGGNGGIANSTIDGNLTYHPDNGKGMTVGWGINSWADIVVSNNVNACPQTAMVYYNLDAGECLTDGNDLYGNISGFTALQYPNNTFDAFANAPDRTYVFDNAYDAHRATVTVYNKSAANSVTVDLSSLAGFAPGDVVQVHNVQNYWIDIQTVTIDTNGRIVIDMQAANRTVETPVGWAAPVTSFPAFGCFVITK